MKEYRSLCCKAKAVHNVKELVDDKGRALGKGLGTWRCGKCRRKCCVAVKEVVA